jgi:hypothetical protein
MFLVSLGTWFVAPFLGECEVVLLLGIPRLYIGGSEVIGPSPFFLLLGRTGSDGGLVPTYIVFIHIVRPSNVL